MRQDDALRLGIIGLSDGNGHPYSWAAIFNGYDPAAMASCPFPAIPDYLAKQVFPRDQIRGARVTHVWAQDKAVAQHVAAASLIPTVVDSYEGMIGEVDAVLLARDDAEHHLEMSIPFLNAGLPIYIDKPVSLTLGDLSALYEHQRFPGQIFSCSALRYSSDFQLSASERERLGEIRTVTASAPKSWEKYGVHIVEPVLNMLGIFREPARVVSRRAGDVTIVSAEWGPLAATFTCLGSAPAEFKINIEGAAASKHMVFADTFAAFKRALEAFVDGVRSRTEKIPRVELEAVVSILERGMIDQDR